MRRPKKVRQLYRRNTVATMAVLWDETAFVQPLCWTVTAALVAAIFFYFVWPTSGNQVKPKARRYLALRIDEVPVDTSVEALEHHLKSMANTDPTLQETIKTLRLHSLVKANRHFAC